MHATAPLPYDAARLRELAEPLAKNGYGQYLLGLATQGRVA